MKLSNILIIIAIADSDVLFQSKFYSNFKAKLYSDVDRSIIFLFAFFRVLCYVHGSR